MFPLYEGCIMVINLRSPDIEKKKKFQTELVFLLGETKPNPEMCK